ncbi:type II CRISPR-associated endonuclease Cas1 [Pseudomonas sp. PDM28]|uniref:type II CRISPR-associated endonuclease Cas1 n=1 Tax=Pseudomonas sp. PDM28 TaxID=2854770 RepID=UPI001C451648|nr:type II CRISPR-associated endonuclease Cas1 [Pseudomonas sp. PDM28]MBV7552010.1 type II CRISPR-associated endonuclease Cas1 [Pseudomonas sp. PDM28]
MSEHRVLLIEHQAYLSIDLGRLCIRRPQQESVFVLPSDIAVLCLHHPAITLTVHTLQTLSQEGAIVLVMDDRHQPLAQVYPLLAPMRQTLRLLQQIKLQQSPWRGIVWQRLVQARLRGEAAVLRSLGKKGALFLERLAEKVQPNDSSQCESQGARHYWKHLLPEGFQRNKQGAIDPLNVRLNFGYAVLRSLIARSLACAGLNGCLGVGHCNQQNPFNLADDFIEPYRFLIEWRVAHQLEVNGQHPFDAHTRKHLAQFMADVLPMPRGDYRLPAAIESTVDSWVQTLDAIHAGRHPSTIMLPEYERWPLTDGGSCG